MKKFPSIPSFLLSQEQASALKLNDQGIIILFPKRIADKAGVATAPVFDLVIKNNKLSLVTDLSTKRETDRSSNEALI